MMYRLSYAIADALCKANVVEKREKELYAYGFFVFLSQGTYFLLSLIFGFLLGIPLESVTFFIMFSKLRRYAGGFHASKESVCLLSTTLTLLLSALAIRELKSIGNMAIPGCLLALASFVIYVNPPPRMVLCDRGGGAWGPLKWCNAAGGMAH